MDRVRYNQIGLPIELRILNQDDAVVDISDATLLQITLKNPTQAGTVSTKTAVLSSDGSDGKMRYVTVDGDLIYLGIWEAQGYVEFNSGAQTYPTSIYKFKVEKVN